MKGLFLSVLFLLSASLVQISSISSQLFVSQLIWMIIGLFFVAIFYFFDWRAVLNYRWFVGGFYTLTIALLVVVYLTAPVIRNTRSWLVLGPFQFQPAEFAKICLILIYAAYFSRKHLSIASWRTLATSFVYFAIPAGLVMLQPDLGSTLVLFGIWFGFLLLSGLPRKKLFIALGAFLLVGIFMWQFGLKDYHRARILGVFFPDRDVLGINYSVSQSKIAIGSAGFWGKGYGQGPQTQLGYLTEPATDFIFSALVEEWGWSVGTLAIIAFFAMIWNILKIGLLADQNFEKFICLGTAAAFSWQFFLNVGSAMGIVPVVGVTFPFLSYGGSSLLTSFLLLAIINAIAIKS